tara:strand:- start:6104 stop:6478 length:375 start_codon:yes stop_codon:yes gene_type:complete
VAITTASAKAKGRKLQQLVRDKVLELLAPRGIVADDVKSTGMGQGGEDVQLSPLARKYLPVSIECKKYAKFAVYGPYEQAEKASGINEPLLVIQGDRKIPLAIVSLDYYLSLEEWRIEGEHNEK